MTDREYKEIQYQAFFDELMGIQKQASLGAIRGAVGGAWQGAKAIKANPMKAAKGLNKAFFTGAKQTGRGATPWQQAWGGLKGAAGTDAGKALIGGGALALGGAGALGAGGGYLAGRSGRQQ